MFTLRSQLTVRMIYFCVDANIDDIEAIIVPTVVNVTEQVHGIPKKPKHNKPKLILKNKYPDD